MNPQPFPPQDLGDSGATYGTDAANGSPDAGEKGDAGKGIDGGEDAGFDAATDAPIDAPIDALIDVVIDAPLDAEDDGE